MRPSSPLARVEHLLALLGVDDAGLAVDGDEDVVLSS